MALEMGESSRVDSKRVHLALRQLITDTKMTPEEFADEAGIDRSTVYRILGDKTYVPRIETMVALLESRSLTLSAFYARIEGAPPPPDLGSGNGVGASGGDFIARFVGAVDQLIASRIVPRGVVLDVGQAPTRAIVLPPTFELTNLPIVVRLVESYSRVEKADAEAPGSPEPSRSVRAGRSRASAGRSTKG